MSSVASTYWQGGLESTRGVAVAADRKLYASAPVPQELRPKEDIQQARQSWVANYDALETHRVVESMPFEWPAVSFNDLAWWLELCAKGSVTPSGAGPYVRTYNGVASSDDLKSATFEVADSIGAFQLRHAMAKSWELAGKGATGPSPVSFKVDCMAAGLVAGHTMTPALAERSLAGTYAAFKNTSLFIDDSAGAIGGSEFTNVEFSVKMDNKLEAQFAGNNSGQYSWVDRGERFMEFMAVLRFDATSYAEFSTNFQNNIARYIELQIDGSGTDNLTIQLCSKLATFEMSNDGASRRVAVMGRSMYDPTLGFDWQAVLTNSVAAI